MDFAILFIELEVGACVTKTNTRSVSWLWLTLTKLHTTIFNYSVWFDGNRLIERNESCIAMLFHITAKLEGHSYEVLSEFFQQICVNLYGFCFRSDTYKNNHALVSKNIQVGNRIICCLLFIC